jgi:hypothetical protein
MFNFDCFAGNIEVRIPEWKRRAKSLRHMWESNINIDVLSEDCVTIWTGLIYSVLRLAFEEGPSSYEFYYFCKTPSSPPF